MPSEGAEEKVLIATRVHPEMREGFKLLAAREKRSVSAQLQVLVEKSVSKFEQEVTRAA